jgi:hypothetical protein
VEYHVNQENGTLMRKFLGSEDTYGTILSSGGFPAPSEEDGLLLADNVLDRSPDAVRGLMLEQLMVTDNFVVLNTNSTRFYGTYAMGNRPAAIEVNIAATDATSMEAENQAIWRKDTSVKLRNAGLYSFRVMLPEPLVLP